MSQENNRAGPKFGYLFHYPRFDHPDEKFRLDLHITSEPTNRHFDVLRVDFSVMSESGQMNQLKVSHPWYFETKAAVCIGRIVMEDRKRVKIEEAFSFGGNLVIETQPEQTDCILTSTAPILDISAATSLHRQFVEEVEILLAEYRVRFEHIYIYEKQLCQTDPIDLYTACLDAMIAKFDQFPDKQAAQYRFLAYLHSEKHKLDAAGLTRYLPPRLDDIFKP